MTGICFYFEKSDIDVWSGHNLDAWNYAIKAAGDINKMIVVNKTDQVVKTPDSDLDFAVFNELPFLDGRAVKIAPPWECDDKAISLWEFDHNVDWYIFGPATEVWSGNLYVPQNGLAALHSAHIASTVMLHRYGVLNGS